MTATRYPNGQTLESSALSVDGINRAVQPVFAQMLGIDPTIDQDAYSKVRISWQTEGQPAQGITDDILYLRCVETGSDYERMRNLLAAQNDSVSVSFNFSYTRTWTVFCVFYGPNSFDHARLVRSGIFIDYFWNLFAAKSLYACPATSNPVRVPELFEGQWWERTDFQIRFNEQVNETIIVPTAASAEILTYTEDGEFSDVTIP